MHGAYLNVQINAADLKDEAFKNELLEAGAKLIAAADKAEQEIMNMVREKL